MSSIKQISNTTPVEQDLEDRILSSFPVNELTFGKLLSLLEIRASSDIPTACVTLGSRSSLLINPEFVAARCRTDESLIMLILHELMHILLGHTRLFERVTAKQNIAFDAIINAQLCLQHPELAYTALFRHSYRDDNLPFALLRPPEGWGTPEVIWKLRNKALRIHKALYSETSVSYLEIYDLLSNSNICIGEADDVPLLGNHKEGEGTPPPHVLDEIAEIVARWPMIDTFSGRDEGRLLNHDTITVISPRRAAMRLIRQALKSLANVESSFQGSPVIEQIDSCSVVPFPTRQDRRANVLRLLGTEPLFYQGTSTAISTGYRNRVHVYLDVSGSMDLELPFVYGALLPLLDHIHPRVHLFSTAIDDISLSDLKEGKVSSTGGTDISLVTGHMIEHKIDKAVFITDGLVGNVPAEHQLELRKLGTRVNTVLTYGGRGDFARSLNGKVFNLPLLK